MIPFEVAIPKLTEVVLKEKTLQKDSSLYLPIFLVGDEGTPWEVFQGHTLISMCGFQWADFESTENLLGKFQCLEVCHTNNTFHLIN